jgi:hypothetical protein
MFPSPAVAVADYDPDAEGWKADALAELRTTKDVVANYCNLAVELGEPCDWLRRETLRPCGSAWID